MRRPLCLALLLLASVRPEAVSAQNVGTSLSGPATADGAAPYYNPAAMGAGHGTHLEIDLGLANLSIQYQPDIALPASNTGAIAPLATLGGFAEVDPEWRIGLTISIPRTTGGSWSREDPAGQITRYYLVAGATFHIAAVPAVSWSPADWITIGLSANLNYGRVSGELDKDFGSQLNQTAGSTEINSPFPYAHPDLAAPIVLAGDGLGVGAIGGVYLRPIPELAFGLSVHSPVIIAGGGSLDVTYPERLQQIVQDTLPSAELPELAANFGVDLDIPTQLIVGLSATPHPMVEIAANYQFEQLSSQPNFNTRISETTSPDIMDTVKPQAYLDRHRAFLRVAVMPIPELRIAAHGVFQANTIPENTFAPNNIDFHRVEVGLAIRWRVADAVSILAQYSHIFLIDQVIDESLHRPLTQPSLTAFNHPTPTGTYSGAADTVRLGMVIHLGDTPEPAEAEEDAPSSPAVQRLDSIPAGADDAGADDAGADDTGADDTGDAGAEETGDAGAEETGDAGADDAGIPAD